MKIRHTKHSDPAAAVANATEQVSQTQGDFVIAAASRSMRHNQMRLAIFVVNPKNTSVVSDISAAKKLGQRLCFLVVQFYDVSSTRSNRGCPH